MFSNLIAAKSIAGKRHNMTAVKNSLVIVASFVFLLAALSPPVLSAQDSGSNAAESGGLMPLNENEDWPGVLHYGNESEELGSFHSEDDRADYAYILMYTGRTYRFRFSPIVQERFKEAIEERGFVFSDEPLTMRMTFYLEGEDQPFFVSPEGTDESFDVALPPGTTDSFVMIRIDNVGSTLGYYQFENTER